MDAHSTHPLHAPRPAPRRGIRRNQGQRAHRASRDSLDSLDAQIAAVALDLQLLKEAKLSILQAKVDAASRPVAAPRRSSSVSSAGSTSSRGSSFSSVSDDYETCL